MIFVDSNVPMYLVGADHENKHRARAILERLISSAERLVTDVEVVQEILHRYTHIERRDAIEPCIDALLGLVDDVFPVELADVLRSRDLLLEHADLSARDALHVAVAERMGVTRILSFDRGFDVVPDLERIAY